MCVRVHAHPTDCCDFVCWRDLDFGSSRGEEFKIFSKLTAPSHDRRCEANSCSRVVNVKPDLSFCCCCCCCSPLQTWAVLPLGNVQEVRKAVTGVVNEEWKGLILSKNRLQGLLDAKKHTQQMHIYVDYINIISDSYSHCLPVPAWHVTPPPTHPPSSGCQSFQPCEGMCGAVYCALSHRASQAEPANQISSR